MKKSTWYRDLLVMLAALCVAGVAVVWVQRITGRIDGVAMLIFMLAVFVTSMYTEVISGACWPRWQVCWRSILPFSPPILPSILPCRKICSPAL